jgi:hypothetical protein
MTPTISAVLTRQGRAGEVRGRLAGSAGAAVGDDLGCKPRGAIVRLAAVAERRQRSGSGFEQDARRSGLDGLDQPGRQHGNDRARRLAGGGGMVEREDRGKTAKGMGQGGLLVVTGGRQVWLGKAAGEQLLGDRRIAQPWARDAPFHICSRVHVRHLPAQSPEGRDAGADEVDDGPRSARPRSHRKAVQSAPRSPAAGPAPGRRGSPDP